MKRLPVVMSVALGVAGAAGAGERDRRTPPGMVTVEATLKAMSKVPSLRDLDTYQESLIACLWEVDGVKAGALEAPRIAVYHWSYIERRPLEATKWVVGLRRTLVLRPWGDVPEVARLHRSEDAALRDLDLPAFYDTAEGVGLPAAVARGQTAAKVMENVRKHLGSDLSAVLCVNGADCHGLNDLHVLYGGAGKGKVVNVGGGGTFFPQHELGYRIAAAECANLEWGIQSGGVDRPCGGFGGVGYSLVFHAGPAWPGLPGRGPAPAGTGKIDVSVLPGVGRGDVESLGVLQNVIREYGRRGKGFILDPEFRNDGQFLRGGDNRAVHERFRSWIKVYPNFVYLHIYDPDAVRAKVKAGLTVSCETIEQARLAMAAKGWPPKPIAWPADPPDPTPHPAALARAVQAGGGGGVVTVGGSWIANVMAGVPGLAAFADAGMPEAELVLRSAVAGGRKPTQVVWGIEPLMLTAPKAELAVSARPGPDWPPPARKWQSQAPILKGVSPIRLGHGTTLARGRGVWEFGLEYSLIQEAALRELKRHQVGVVLALGPNDAGIPPVAYEGLVDRLRAYTIIYDGVRFVEPGEVAGKADAAIRVAIEAHIADSKRGVMTSPVPVRGGW